MHFIEVSILDWYDNIIKAFCKTEDNTIYYCSLVYIDKSTDNKIYICVDIEFFEAYEQIISFIESDALKEHWDELYSLLNNIRSEAKLYLIETDDLMSDQSKFIRYNENVEKLEGLLFADYPDLLEETGQVDNWPAFFK
ncbi:hypothetical protein [Hufsiella ginkgonis]|uniref:DUF600 family protein n=1 Tax=Hufsiella ginkgonis TaxID=2695274 RepID=A0A7K1XT45_9SPHI|nr:hypothetical protein [Hufsiella ginkgonis]MXV14173.1 hypothetical protein [Hufsiella ginkgonis]